MERELPKQVFIDGCEQISMEFEPIAFRFAKTGPHASRRAGDWAFKISFQSNYLNVGGEYVELVVHASVYSKAIKEWGGGHGTSQTRIPARLKSRTSLPTSKRLSCRSSNVSTFRAN